MLFSASFYICNYSFFFFFADSINTSKSELFHNQDRLFQTFLLFPISLFYYLIVLKIPLFSMQVSIFRFSSYSQTLAQLNFKVAVLENNTWILDSEDFIITGMPLISPPVSKASYILASEGNLSSLEDILLHHISLLACISPIPSHLIVVRDT